MIGTSLRYMDLNLILVLNTVLRTGNVTLAAAELNMSQPSVSRALARLRAIFADPLFIKTSRGVVPTSKASALAPLVDEVLSSIENLTKSHISAVDKLDIFQCEAHFRVAAGQSVSRDLLRELAVSLASEAPFISLEVDFLSREWANDLRNGDVDLVIKDTSIFTPLEFKSRFLYKETNVCVIGESHQLYNIDRNELNLIDYGNSLHIKYLTRGFKGDMVENILDKFGIDRRIGIFLPTWTDIVPIISDTNLLATIPYSNSLSIQRYSHLRVLQAPAEFRESDFHMVWHERTHNDLASAWFRARLLEIASSHIAQPKAASS